MRNINRRTWIKTIGFFLLIGVFFALIGFTRAYHWPTIRDWLRVKIAEETKSSPVWILPGNISIGLFPLGIHLHDVRAITQNGLEKTLDSFTVQKLSAVLSLESLLSGNYRLLRIEIKGAHFNVQLPEARSETPPKELPPKRPPKESFLLPKAESIYEYLNFPLYQLALLNSQITLKQTNSKSHFQINQLNLLFENRGRSVFVELDTPHFSYLEWQKDKYLRTAVSLSTRALLEYGRVTIPYLKAERSNTNVELAAGFDFNPETLKLGKKTIRIKTEALLPEVTLWINALNPHLSLPAMKGEIKLSADLTEENEDRTAQAILEAKSISIDKYKVGDVSLRAVSDGKKVRLIESRIHRKQIDLGLDSFEFDLASKKFKVEADVKKFELQQLLRDIDVGDIPVILHASGRLPCSGELSEKLNVECSGSVKIEDLNVYNENEKEKKQFTIVKLKDGMATGSVKIDLEKVVVDANLQIGNSKGTANGTVKYKSGFRFDYNTDSFDFKDITTLAQLKFDGSTSINGFTEGNSKYAVIFMNLKPKDFWFEDYGVGGASLQLSYRKSHLFLEGVSGNFQNSRYFGNVDINLSESSISGRFRFPSFELGDLQSAFSRKVSLPFQSFGQGKGKVQFSGPLEFTKLSYELDIESDRSLVAGETFDSIKFNVVSKVGEVKAKNVSATKGRARAIMTGEGHPNGQIECKLVGEKFELEQSQWLEKFGLEIGGTTDFNLSLKGHVLKPELNIQGIVTNPQSTGYVFPDLDYKIKLNSKDLLLQGSLKDNSLAVQTRIPFSNLDPFYLKINATRFNFAPLLANRTNANFSNEYQSMLTFDGEIQSPSDYLWNADGAIDFKEIRIQRGTKELYLQKPSQVDFKKGKMSIAQMNLLGDNTLLEVTSRNSSKTNLDLKVNGKVDTSIVSFLTPFLQEIRGILSIRFRLAGSFDAPQFLGSAFVDEGFAQLKEFPHPFESIRTDVLFSQSKITINSFLARMTTGKVSATGSIDLHGFKDIRADINANLSNVRIRVPEGVETQGDANLSITGNWFPYLIKGNYTVLRAAVKKEFDGSSAIKGDSKKSIFLPQTVIAEESNSPIKLDIQTFFERRAEIQNSLIESPFFGKLRILGVPENPILLGQIQMPKGGTFYFRETPFIISAADFKFETTDEINPSLFLTANARVKEYDISVIVRGTSKNYSIRFQSSPPLSEPDIVSLLALGVTSSELEQFSSEEQLNKQGYEIGSALLSQNPIGKTLKEQTGFEFKFSSAIDDSDTSTSPKAVPKVVISRQWTQKIGTSVSRTLGDTATQDFKVEYQLNNNISLIGSWEDREVNQESSTTIDQDEVTDILGIDLKYQVEFK
ncbi:MAG: translocation/assembly module TamB domain-containing protein [Bdellovibrionales bacterium]|nr:translocation/assembly module TamB domain-containing protein [Bdellovibrionales bacterium]